MKKLFLIANWKSNKTINETEGWLHAFYDGLKQEKFILKDKEIIVCPSFTLFEHARYCSKNLDLPIKFGAQNISQFGEGAYTGEISGRQIKEVASYVIVGHSERRKYFGETDGLISKKLEMAGKHGLTPILCVSAVDQAQSAKRKAQNYSAKFKTIIAYEPLFAIGSGQADTPDNAEKTALQIKETMEDTPVLYGGSVTSENVNSFTKMPNIDGVLVGGASLDALEFLGIIKNA